MPTIVVQVEIEVPDALTQLHRLKDERLDRVFEKEIIRRMDEFKKECDRSWEPEYLWTYDIDSWVKKEES